ncbi:MAG: MBL fold metallo-hydrolase [Chloroflexota bacterium]
MLKIGDFEMHLIKESIMNVDGGGAFGLIPRKLWSRYVKPDADNLIPMSQNCLYVKAHGKHIVVDTGIGSKLTKRLRRMYQIENENGLVTALAQLGITPSEIDLVINTHLHFDHAGGNTIWDDDGNIQATFPNAEYVVQRGEYDDAMHPNERTSATYFPDNYVPLVENSQMRLLDGDTEILEGITGIVTPGHTPFHMSIRFESQSEHGAFVCDLASFAVHFERLAWMTAYDVEPLRTMETKRIWQQWAIDHEATLIFPHDVTRPVGRLRASDVGVPILETIDEAFVNAD